MLAACTTTKPTGPATSPTSPQWRAHEQAVQQLSTYQTRGSFAYSDRKSLRPLLLAAVLAGALPPAADQPARQHGNGSQRAEKRGAADRQPVANATSATTQKR
ncbi:hypothetical protein M8494_14115 [Serratia ureilytica]